MLWWFNVFTWDFITLCETETYLSLILFFVFSAVLTWGAWVWWITWTRRLLMVMLGSATSLRFHWCKLVQIFVMFNFFTEFLKENFTWFLYFQKLLHLFNLRSLFRRKLNNITGLFFLLLFKFRLHFLFFLKNSFFFFL